MHACMVAPATGRGNASLKKKLARMYSMPILCNVQTITACMACMVAAADRGNCIIEKKVAHIPILFYYFLLLSKEVSEVRVM